MHSSIRPKHATLTRTDALGLPVEQLPAALGGIINGILVPDDEVIDRGVAETLGRRTSEE